jgi:hypothetical protein
LSGAGLSCGVASIPVGVLLFPFSGATPSRRFRFLFAFGLVGCYDTAMTRNGSITLNGIRDSELIVILKVKEKSESNLTFNPQQIQPVMEAVQPNNQQKQVGYNNVIVHWQNEDGLKAVLEMLHELVQRP